MMQRRKAVIVFDIDIGSRFKKNLSGRSILPRRDVQRRKAPIVFGIDIGSRFKKNLGGRRSIRRRVQRRKALRSRLKTLAVVYI